MMEKNDVWTKVPNHKTMASTTTSMKTTAAHHQKQTHVNHTTTQQHTTNKKSETTDTIPTPVFVLSNKVNARKSDKK